MRVLILSTPFDARAHLDGSRRAVADLVPALIAKGVEPTVLVSGGEAPAGARVISVATGRARALDSALATVLADADVIHAWFAPRLATSAVLRAVRRARGVPIVQTIPSLPRRLVGVRAAIAGDRVIATSDATAIALATHGVDARRMARIPSPFAQEANVPRADAPRDLLLYGGDWEFDDGVERALHAFARMAPPRGVTPHLAIAARAKTPRAREVERRIRQRLRGDSVLRDRVTILGELPSLLPWIAASRGVIVPAATTYAKLDHPRVLLEALALGVRVIVGTAPSLAELVDDPRVGDRARDEGELRDALERCFSEPPPPASALTRVLAPRRPEAVAARYATLYRELTTRPP